MKLSIFTSTTKDGIMSSEEKYFKNLSHEERKLLHETTIKRFLNKYGLDNKIIIIDENSTDKAKKITNKTVKTKARIVMLKETIENTIVGVETEDDPVLVATAPDEKEKSTSAIALCTLENLKNNLLTEIVDNLMKETNKAPFEMTFYIGACPSDKYYEITREDKDNSLFKGAVTKKGKKYYLNIRLAIFNALKNEIVDPNMMYFDSTDTVENNNYFSKYKQKSGKNIICIKYIEE